MQDQGTGGEFCVWTRIIFLIKDAPFSTTDRTGGPVADAVKHGWVDRWAPARLRPWLRLSRADRPAGYWLLLFPCWWSVMLALPVWAGNGPLNSEQLLFVLKVLLLFGIGAIAMRGAGCTYNDIVDRDFDGQVARTRSRPLPSGQVTLWQAVAFLLVQCLAGLLVLLQFNVFAIWLGIASLLPVLVYPFMKRITNWPQVVLGASFAWGSLMGWAALLGRLDPAPVFLFAGTVFWIIGYDTIYAHQDREDDSLIGLGSTALALGQKTWLWVGVFYTLAMILIFVAGFLVYKSLILIWLLLPAALHLGWQVYTLDIEDPENCLQRFRSNQTVGWLVLLAFGGMYLWHL